MTAGTRTSRRRSSSTPTGGTTYGFDDACREHDLAYDLLRYRYSRDGTIDPWARWSADARFGRRMAERCTEQSHRLGGCLVTAGVYGTVVAANSARQLWGPPLEETSAQVAGSTLALAGVLVLLVGPTPVGRVLRGRRGVSGSGPRARATGRPHGSPDSGPTRSASAVR